jgi:prophage maintenance system killer protein
LFAGELLYGSPFARAAALLDSLNETRPFASGNRAVAIMAAALWLEREGYRLETEEDELVQIARSPVDVDELTAWLRRNSARLS